ncbi:hypothetical protein JCM33374_g4396 [Metschnikowia sp. JCM 33374]|nr:hypothetical protein JCM33374_g4396 [Metschnikowia sp. JCM 33374]
MSFFIVPTMSYQQQQKMKQQQKSRAKPKNKLSRVSSGASGASDASLSRSASLATHPTHSSLPTHPTHSSVPTHPNHSSLPTHPNHSASSLHQATDSAPVSAEEKPPSLIQRLTSTSRKRSETSQSIFPSLSSRRPSVASDASRGSSNTGHHSTFSGFTPIKQTSKVPETDSEHNEAAEKETHKFSCATPETDPEVATEKDPQALEKGTHQDFNDTTNERPVDETSPNKTSPQHASPQQVSPQQVSYEPKPIPEYVPFTDSSVFNSEVGIRNTFIYPRIPLQKFEDFLDVIADHHVNDPINFATVREHSLAKFLGRRTAALYTRWESMSDEEKKDRSCLERFLSLQLLKCRSILRTSLKLQLQNKSCYRKLACEQLIQGNFMNYVRHIIAFPELTAEESETLTETQKTDYEIKKGFTSLADAFYALKKDNYEGDISTLASRVEMLLSEIKKTAIDFILLEKYTIQILVKLNNDFMIESRITKYLFNLYDLNIHLEKPESLKVLVFNSSFSSNYSWYLAITLPFVRVFEASLLNENVSFAEKESGQTSLRPSSAEQTSLQESDAHLFKTYFSRLNLSDYSTFSKISRKELVRAHRRHANKVNPGKLLVRPINFEYYAHSMSTIRSETFRVIQSRDFTSQVMPANYGNMLREFHRLLKKGGVLELPMMIPGVECFGSLNNQQKGTKANSSAEDSNSDSTASVPGTKSAEWSHNFTFDRVKSIISSLGELFGAHNVKFSSVLLNSKNQMNAFLIKHTEMSLHESFNDSDHFQAFKESIGNLGKTEADDIHFYFYIKAEKL